MDAFRIELSKIGSRYESLGITYDDFMTAEFTLHGTPQPELKRRMIRILEPPVCEITFQDRSIYRFFVSHEEPGNPIIARCQALPSDGEGAGQQAGPPLDSAKVNGHALNLLQKAWHKFSSSG